MPGHHNEERLPSPPARFVPFCTVRHDRCEDVVAELHVELCAKLSVPCISGQNRA